MNKHTITTEELRAVDRLAHGVLSTKLNIGLRLKDCASSVKRTSERLLQEPERGVIPSVESPGEKV